MDFGVRKTGDNMKNVVRACVLASMVMMLFLTGCQDTDPTQSAYGDVQQQEVDDAQNTPQQEEAPQEQEPMDEQYPTEQIS